MRTQNHGSKASTIATTAGLQGVSTEQSAAEADAVQQEGILIVSAHPMALIIEARMR
jgi:hypothetical protein